MLQDIFFLIEEIYIKNLLPVLVTAVFAFLIGLTADFVAKKMGLTYVNFFGEIKEPKK